jgi:hypothetical protein
MEARADESGGPSNAIRSTMSGLAKKTTMGVEWGIEVGDEEIRPCLATKREDPREQKVHAAGGHQLKK